MSESRRQTASQLILLSLVVGLALLPHVWEFVTAAVYEAIPMLKRLMAGVKGSDCPICREPVGSLIAGDVRETWSALPCGHRFGSYCIKHYLGLEARNDPVCPVCRRPAFHQFCGHPVLPMVLRPDGTHPDLVSDSAGNLHHKGEEFFISERCQYCIGPRPVPTPKPRWKRAFRWLCGLVPPVRSSSTSTVSHHDPSARRPPLVPARPTPRQRLQRLREGGSWYGPWLDVRPREPDWEAWWNVQIPRGTIG